MKKQKIIVPVLAALMLTACGSQPAEAPAENTSEPSQAEASASTPKPAASETAKETAEYAGFQRGQTVYDDNGILITLADIKNVSSAVQILLDVENKTDHKVRVGVMRGYFNGFEASRNAKHSPDLEAGQKQTQVSEFRNTYFDFYLDRDPDVIDLYLEMWELDPTRSIDKPTVTIASEDSTGEFEPAETMKPLGEEGKYPANFYQAGNTTLEIDYCSVPSSVPLNGLALLSVSGRLRSSFIHPSCTGRNFGNYFFIVCFEEMSDRSHLYTADNIKINGKDAGLGQFGGVRSTPGKGGFFYIGIPYGMDPEDIESFSFTINCDDEPLDEFTWAFD